MQNTKTYGELWDLGIALLGQYMHALSSLHMTLPLVHRLNDIQLMVPGGENEHVEKNKTKKRDTEGETLPVA
jgi:hypothetical protein